MQDCGGPVGFRAELARIAGVMALGASFGGAIIQALSGVIANASPGSRC
jgi:hypothetical protein